MNSPLLDSVVVVLREVLEFSLLVGVLLVAGRCAALRARWLVPALLAGVGGAGLYGARLRVVSTWFDGVGYEVVNGGLQILVYVLILAVIGLWLQTRHREPARALPWVMAGAVALAVTREGSEIFLYFSAFMGRPRAVPDLLIGAVLGIGVGFSIGALLYYLLLAFRRAVTFALTVGLLALIGAGMWSQATMLLVQADWLPASQPLWNSSAWLPEGSLLGQLLYALIGYEATPGPWQVGLYGASILLALGVAAAAAYGSGRAIHSRRRPPL